mmetsp:Transcript_3400/g.14898  ORF Transcript_3400/g.14898 Transcript_3400/m.14898 type:complete len:255 (-) Transcript_3400:3942-4706(-)
MSTPSGVAVSSTRWNNLVAAATSVTACGGSNCRALSSACRIFGRFARSAEIGRTRVRASMPATPPTVACQFFWKHACMRRGKSSATSALSAGGIGTTSAAAADALAGSGFCSAFSSLSSSPSFFSPSVSSPFLSATASSSALAPFFPPFFAEPFPSSLDSSSFLTSSSLTSGLSTSILSTSASSLSVTGLNPFLAFSFRFFSSSSSRSIDALATATASLACSASSSETPVTAESHARVITPSMNVCTARSAAFM